MLVSKRAESHDGFSVQTFDIESLGGSALDAGDGEGEDGEDLGELHVGLGWCEVWLLVEEEGDVVILEAKFSMLHLSMSRFGEEKACYLSFLPSSGVESPVLCFRLLVVLELGSTRASSFRVQSSRLSLSFPRFPPAIVHDTTYLPYRRTPPTSQHESRAYRPETTSG